MNAELKQAKLELSTVHVEIEKKTAKLLADRKSILTKELKSLENKLTSLAEREGKLIESIRKLNVQIPAKQLVLSELNDVTLGQNADIVTLENTRTTLKADVDRLNEEKTSIDSKIFDKLQRIPSLEQTEMSLNASIESLTSQKVTLLNEVQELEAERTRINTLKSDELGKWDAKLLKVKQDMSIIRNVIDKEASELADRKLVQDEREKVLRVRERKATIQEDTIHRNASLLDL